MPVANDPIPVVAHPSPRGWAAAPALLAARDRARRGWPADLPAPQTLRAELGLSDELPVVMAGHQAEFWHPGILAKYFAAAAGAQAAGALAAWVVVDQDEGEPFSIRYPVRRPDGTLESRTWRASESSTSAPLPTGLTPAAEPAPLLSFGDSPPAAPGVAPGLANARASLARHAGEPTAARQLTLAAFDLLAPFCPPPMAVFATRLASTSLMLALVDRMLGDAPRCIAAYNCAARAFPRSRIAPLAPDELPLWRIRPADARERVGVRDLASIPPGELAPRALLVTGLLRMGAAACDVFIHGLGGGASPAPGDTGPPVGYDRITEKWLGDWLGVELAPAVLITATLRLNIPMRPGMPRADDVLRAHWRAHHARHDPALLGDAAAAAEKMRLVAAIRAARRRNPPAAAALYRQMHAMLDSARRAGAAELARLDADTAFGGALRRDAVIIADRTWPFPIYEVAQLRSLADAVSAAFAPARTSR